MSGRRSRALKADGMNRAERRRTIRRTATAPTVLAAMHAEVERLELRRLKRPRRWGPKATR